MYAFGLTYLNMYPGSLIIILIIVKLILYMASGLYLTLLDMENLFVLPHTPTHPHTPGAETAHKQWRLVHCCISDKRLEGALLGLPSESLPPSKPTWTLPVAGSAAPGPRETQPFGRSYPCPQETGGGAVWQGMRGQSPRAQSWGNANVGVLSPPDQSPL